MVRATEIRRSGAQENLYFRRGDGCVNLVLDLT